jgi:hypothetical protein
MWASQSRSFSPKTRCHNVQVSMGSSWLRGRDVPCSLVYPDALQPCNKQTLNLHESCAIAGIRRRFEAERIDSWLTTWWLAPSPPINPFLRLAATQPGTLVTPSRTLQHFHHTATQPLCLAEGVQTLRLEETPFCPAGNRCELSLTRSRSFIPSYLAFACTCSPRSIARRRVSVLLNSTNAQHQSFTACNLGPSLV